MSDFKTYLCLMHDGEEHEIEVRISYDATYQAAYTTGLPENCYPAEGEMDLTAVEAIGELPDGITQSLTSVRPPNFPPMFVTSPSNGAAS